MLVEVDLNDYTGFVVTGKFAYTDRNFPAMNYPATVSGFRTAFSINLWRGNIWGIKKSDGKRKLLHWVYN